MLEYFLMVLSTVPLTQIYNMNVEVLSQFRSWQSASRWIWPFHSCWECFHCHML